MEPEPPIIDKVQVLCGDNNQTPTKKALYVGMVFETVEDARKYYEDYGRQEGFCIRTRNSSKARSRCDGVSNAKFVCVHEGKHIAKNDEINIAKGESTKRRRCSTVMGGCNASLRVVHDKFSGEYVVTGFNDEHNHKLVMPARRMKMKSNRHMPNVDRDLTEAFHTKNLEVGKIPSILDGSHIGFDRRDCYNHLTNVWYRDGIGGDAQSVLTYFRRKKEENPQFFYAVQCDESGRVANLFWVDARSRMAYEYFGDVVTFDTTYRTKKYDMPFAPFIGVNHHLQTVQFGCALLQDETEVTFLWLFQTWLEAMGGRHPVSIITGQDLAIGAAIAKVFPNTRHRLCLWHIEKKFVEKLSQVYFKKSNFKTGMGKCIWSTYKGEDFEKMWQTLIVDNELEENEWLQQLFKIRHSWAPVYIRDIFFAGMNTTGWNEGINSFFDAFVTSSTNLREFVVKYEQALKKIVQNESDEDFVTQHKYRIVRDSQFLLKHAAKVYTRNVFNKFEVEWNHSEEYKVIETGSDNEYHTYIVKSKIGEPHEFVVKLNLQTYEGMCECQYFPFIGILCRHMLRVFARLDIDTIPRHFILPRWQQEANKFRIMDSGGLVKNDGKEESEILRLSHMCQISTKLACHVAPSHEAYTIFVETINELSKRLSKMKIDVVSNEVIEPTLSLPQIVGDGSASQSLLLDPNISQTKDRKKDAKEKDLGNSSGRLKSGHMFSHDKRSCPSNPNRKKFESTNQISENEEIHELG